jgi:hypothetical protein
MSELLKPHVFSVKREDLLFDYAATFEDLFKVSMFPDEEPRSESGIRLQKNSGYDFQSECKPVVEVSAVTEELLVAVGGKLSDYNINITIEDVCLNIRKLIFSFGMEELSQKRSLTIDLKSIKEAAFYGGFEIWCFISRKTNIESTQNLIWNKSQQIYGATFIAKASGEEALFEISWVTFSDQEDQKDVLAYVDWKSSAVSTELDVDCFEVKANLALRDQVTRLNNARNFGGFCIRMLAEKILKELVLNCLRYADLNGDPQQDSLHDRVKAFLDGENIDFNELAGKAQSANVINQLQVEADISKLLQRNTKIGSTLSGIRFGGFL